MTATHKPFTRQEYEIALSIEGGGKKDKNDEGRWIYTDGVSDQTIADKHQVKVTLVQSLRTDIFGQLR